jgi:hypothetical protein
MTFAKVMVLARTKAEVRSVNARLASLEGTVIDAVITISYTLIVTRDSIEVLI